MAHAMNSRKTSFHRFVGFFAGLCMFIALGEQSASAGENFTTFIKSADMSGAYFLSYQSSPQFLWDGTSTSLNTPFQDLQNNGVNYVRLNCWYSTTNSSQGLNLANLQTVAAVAVAHNMKLYIDAIPADGGQAFQSYPSAWQADWKTATENGTNFNWDSTRGAALAADVHAYYNNIVTTLEANPSIGANAVGIVSIGNEINEKFVGVPSGTSLFYELVYKGAAGVNAETNPPG